MFVWHMLRMYTLLKLKKLEHILSTFLYTVCVAGRLVSLFFMLYMMKISLNWIFNVVATPDLIHII